MDGALMAAGIESHCPHKIGSRHRTLSDQDAAGSGTDGKVEGAVDCGEHFPRSVARGPFASLECILGDVGSGCDQIGRFVTIGNNVEFFKKLHPFAISWHDVILFFQLSDSFSR